MFCFGQCFNGIGIEDQPRGTKGASKKVTNRIKAQREMRTGMNKKNVKYKDSREVRIFFFFSNFANAPFYYT